MTDLDGNDEGNDANAIDGTTSTTTLVVTVKMKVKVAPTESAR